MEALPPGPRRRAIAIATTLSLSFAAPVRASDDEGPGFAVGLGTLEGGADTDDVSNFAWLNYAVGEIRYRF